MERENRWKGRRTTKKKDGFLILIIIDRILAFGRRWRGGREEPPFPPTIDSPTICKFAASVSLSLILAPTTTDTRYNWWCPPKSHPGSNWSGERKLSSSREERDEMEWSNHTGWEGAGRCIYTLLKRNSPVRPSFECALMVVTTRRNMAAGTTCTSSRRMNPHSREVRNSIIFLDSWDLLWVLATIEYVDTTIPLSPANWARKKSPWPTSLLVKKIRNIDDG